MTDEKTSPEGEVRPKPKRTYKKGKPSVEAIIEAIKEGHYDDEIFELREAINGRMEAKQEKVMELVHQAFGDEAVVVQRTTHIEEATDTPPMPRHPSPPEVITPSKPNPFLQKLVKDVATENDLDGLAERHTVLDEIPSGQYKIHPGNGTLFRVDTSVESPEGIVMITDTSGHQIGIAQEEWDSWPDQGAQPEPAPGVTTVVEQDDFERRGAIVAGLHPADIAE